MKMPGKTVSDDKFGVRLLSIVHGTTKRTVCATPIFFTRSIRPQLMLEGATVVNNDIDVRKLDRFEISRCHSSPRKII